MKVKSDFPLILYLSKAGLTVLITFWRLITMDMSELRMKEQRFSCWDRFGVIFPDEHLKELIAEDREVAM
jgi:hypothetical protein